MILSVYSFCLYSVEEQWCCFKQRHTYTHIHINRLSYLSKTQLLWCFFPFLFSFSRAISAKRNLYLSRESLKWSELGILSLVIKWKKKDVACFFVPKLQHSTVYTPHFLVFKVFFMSSSMSWSRDLAGLAQSSKDSSLKPHRAHSRNQTCLGKEIWEASYKEIHPKGKVSRVSQIRFTVITSKLKRSVILNKCFISQSLFLT